ncbi:MAG: flavodoxin family protein [Clostridia bacterium]|nr:flavodoxin family protein [Clostridia bacterium]
MAIRGSLRGRNGNTHRIVDPLLEGAREAGAETEEVFLVERDIKHCRGCFGCWGKTPGKCVINDEMPGLIDPFLESDYVGLGAPVYSMYMTGLLKDFMDRLLPLATPHIRKSADGAFYHNGRIKRCPRVFCVANCGFLGEHNFDMLKAMVVQMSPVLEVYCNCGEALCDAEAAAIPAISEFYDALRQAGKEIVTGGRVSEETVRRIHAELMSDEEYMARANQHWDEEIGRAESQS